MATKKGLTTQEGYELQLGTNMLGHFLLTQLLLPKLLATASLPRADVRVVHLTSEGHKLAPNHAPILDQEALMELDPWPRYGNSKLCNILFAKGLAKRYPQLTSVAVHPGVIETDLFNASKESSTLLKVGMGVFGPIFTQSVAQGARNTLWAATTKKSEVESGGYYTPVGYKELGSRTARDDAGYGSDKVWAWCDEEAQKHGFEAKLEA